MREIAKRGVAVLGLVAGLAVSGACASPVEEPEVRWVREGAGEAELEADRKACLDLAAGTQAESKRFDHVAKGSAFLRCMTERGWRQEPAPQ